MGIHPWTLIAEKQYPDMPLPKGYLFYCQNIFWYIRRHFR